WFGLPGLDLRSPLITGLPLSLLLRADTAWLFALAGVTAIGSKFLLRPRRQAHLQPGRPPASGYRRASAARRSGFPLCPVLRDPGAAGGAPFRHCNLLSREPRHAPFRAHLVAGRSGRHPTASAAERRATDFYLLYDLGSAHEPGLAAGAFPVRARGRVTGALACILPADAASALRCPHRARAIRVPARRRSAGPALCLGKPRQRRSILMGTTPRLKTVIAAAALLTGV